VATPQAVLYVVSPLLVKLDPDGTLVSDGPTVLQSREFKPDWEDTVETLFEAAVGYQFEV